MNNIFELFLSLVIKFFIFWHKEDIHYIGFYLKYILQLGHILLTVCCFRFRNVCEEELWNIGGMQDSETDTKAMCPDSSFLDLTWLWWGIWKAVCGEREREGRGERNTETWQIERKPEVRAWEYDIGNNS